MIQSIAREQESSLCSKSFASMRALTGTHRAQHPHPGCTPCKRDTLHSRLWCPRMFRRDGRTTGPLQTMEHSVRLSPEPRRCCLRTNCALRHQRPLWRSPAYLANSLKSSCNARFNVLHVNMLSEDVSTGPNLHKFRSSDTTNLPAITSWYGLAFLVA